MTTTEQTAVNRSTTNGHALATMQTPKSKRIVGASQRRIETLNRTGFDGRNTSCGEHSRRMLTSYWKCCCPGKVTWQR